MAGDTPDPVEPFRVSRRCGVPAADRTRRDAESTPTGLNRGLGQSPGGNYALLPCLTNRDQGEKPGHNQRAAAQAVRHEAFREHR